MRGPLELATWRALMSFKIVPPAAELGAEIRGIDLARPLSDATVDALKAAWGKRSVLLFRG